MDLLLKGLRKPMQEICKPLLAFILKKKETQKLSNEHPAWNYAALKFGGHEKI